MHRPLLAMTLATVLGLAACGVDAESNTGLLLRVTVTEEVLQQELPPDISGLRFYLAVRVNADTDTWVLNEALAGRPVTLPAGRDLASLRSDPYRLFVAASGAGEMETVRVMVVGEQDGQPVLMGTLEEPAEQTLQSGRIISRTVTLRAGATPGALTWTQTGCLMTADGSIAFGSAEDQDCDGYVGVAFGGEDCDDQDPAINPSADDSHDCDGKDNNCDGIVDPGGNDDNDGDGVTACQGDCDDTNGDIYPGTEERCDNIDNNCNGKCDEGCDGDGDGYTENGTLIVNGGEECVRVPVGDCDDDDPAINPEAEEKPDGRDNNCNGLCDEGTDRDGDGYNEAGTMDGTPVQVAAGGECPIDPAAIDCAPEDPAIHPFAPELCDGVNTDCNSETTPADAICYQWQSDPSDGVCLQGTSTCTEGGGNWSWGDCQVNAITAETAAPARCAAWDLCSSEMQPDRCMVQKLQRYDLDCDVTMWHPGSVPCVENPPTYYLPFGLTGMSGCTWYLQLDYDVPGWQTVGLIDPTASQAAPADYLESCEAALVARPSFDGAAPAAITGTISFVDTTSANPFLLVMRFSIAASSSEECLVDSSMSCELNPAVTSTP